MAVTLTVANKLKYEMGIGTIDFSSATFKVALMATSFAFGAGTHGLWSDASGSEITPGSGYAAGGETLTAATAWAQDNASDQAAISWSDVTWTASGGDIGPFGAAIIYNSSHASSVVVGCIDLGTDVTVSDGNDFTLKDLGYDYT